MAKQPDPNKKWRNKLRDGGTRFMALIRKAVKMIANLFRSYRSGKLRNVIFELTETLKKIYNNGINESLFRFFEFENVPQIDWDALITADHIQKIRDYYSVLANDKAIYFVETLDWDKIKESVEYLNHKSQVIGWTETHIAIQETDFMNAERLGYMYKTWLTFGDEKVRPTHRKQQGMTIMLPDRFPNGLLYPADTSTGNPKEYVNCRCFLMFHKEPTGNEQSAW